AGDGHGGRAGRRRGHHHLGHGGPSVSAAATSVHPSSVVDPSARVHRDATIGPFCVVGPDVVIGEGCRLLSHVVVHAHTALGPGNVLFPGASIGGDPQDLKY